MYPLNINGMPSTASSMFSAYASFAAFIMLVKSMADQLMSLMPPQLRSYLASVLRRFYNPHSSDLTLVVDEKCGYVTNQVYESAEIYLRTKISLLNERLRVSRTPGQKTLSITIDRDEEIMDTFDHIILKWRYVCIEAEKNGDKEKRHFELAFQKRHKTEVMDTYLPYVLAQAKALKQKEKVLKLTSGADSDDSVDLEHPSTLDTLAIAPEMRKMIIEDLDRFLKRKEFYKKVGKAWKRGYLLYGPPGTGKSSLIAAMANYLQFDVYDVELSSVYSNSELRSIMLSTSNRSILVIEDIDCTAETQNREEEKSEESRPNFTLSGLLNFIDGLWSSCADGRIIVFTTNHKEKLDPALLRPGRMDVHIHLSYCTPSGFRILASNYLDIHESNPHHLCGEIEGLIERIEVTAAEIAEELMKGDDADVVLEGLVSFLKGKEVEVKSNSTRPEETEKAVIEATN